MRTAGLAGTLIVLLAAVPLIPLSPRRVRPDARGVIPAAMAVSDSAGSGPRAEGGNDSSPAERIRVIPVDTLPDIAVANYDERGSEIYYNPEALRQLGPQIAAFMMAHERGHIHLRHTRANALLAGRSALDSVLQGREMAADCYAAETVGARDPAAVMAAARFFGRLGSVHFDAAHPTGAQRAAHILACLPPATSDSSGPSLPNPAIVLDSTAGSRDSTPGSQ
jgi:hypothetical protein